MIAVVAIVATAAALVAAAQGSQNDPLSASFHLDGMPSVTATLRFALPPHPKGATARLQLQADSASRTGYVVANALGTVRSASFAARTATLVNVTPLLPPGASTLTLDLKDPGPTAIRFAGAASPTPPVLLLQVGGATRRIAPTGAPSGGPPTASGAAEQGVLYRGKTAVIAAAGDIACDPTDPGFAHPQPGRCAEVATSKLLLGIPHLAAVLTLGDNQYECGRADAYARSYAPSWGRLLKLTHPVPGNHEYGRSCKLNDPSPYFSYFGRAAGPLGKGWYSYDIAQWHLIALNSECSYGAGNLYVGGCGVGSPQERWLRRDLAAHRNACTLAYWHEPRFSSGEHGDAAQMSRVWNDLVAAHVDLVLSGHNHDYERFAPIGATPPPPGAADSTTTGAPIYQQPLLQPTGVREFVVGTGGKNLYQFEPSQSTTTTAPLLGEQVRNDKVFGVLELTLLPKAYTWRFVSTAHVTIDKGAGVCH